MTHSDENSKVQQVKLSQKWSLIQTNSEGSSPIPCNRRPVGTRLKAAIEGSQQTSPLESAKKEVFTVIMNVMEHSEVLNDRNEREFPQKDKKKRRRNRWFKQTWRMREEPGKNLTSLGSNESGVRVPRRRLGLWSCWKFTFFSNGTSRPSDQVSRKKTRNPWEPMYPEVCAGRLAARCTNIRRGTGIFPKRLALWNPDLPLRSTAFFGPA